MKAKYLLQIIGIILFGIIGNIHSVHAQIASTELKIDDQSIYTIKVIKDDDYVITVDSLNKVENNTITVTNFTSSVLEQFILNTHQRKNKGYSKMTDKTKSLIALKFMELQGALFNVPQEGQKIAYVKLNESVTIRFDSTKSKTNKKGKAKTKKNGTEKKKLFFYEKVHCECDASFIVNDARIVFEDGFIKSILVTGIYGGKEYIFSNNYGIGISTRNNIRKLVNHSLFNEQNIRDSIYINLSEVLDYTRILEVRTNDYSPVDQTVYITPKQEEGIIVRKNPSQEIFTLNVFSDFVGVNQDNPNGLIQTEFSKRINFVTYRKGFLFGTGIGGFTHIKPSFELTKIEQNNREMPLSQYQVNDSTVTNFANPLQVLRYSTANVKTEVNIIDVQGAALNIHVNGFVGMAVTHVNDSIKEEGVKKHVEESINSFLTGGNMKFIFNPENKWSYTMVGTATYIKNLNDQLSYYTLKSNNLESVNNWLLGAEFLVTWNTNDDNKLFGRFRYNWESNNVYNNYSQFQVGYSIKFKASKPTK